MKLYNLKTNDGVKLAVEKEGKLYDISPLTMRDVISGAKMENSGKEITGEYANVVEPGKIVCVGLNYKAHADNVSFKAADVPTLFSKFNDALTPADSNVVLPPWETSYDYEAELVVVIGKKAWNVTPDEAGDYIFGYTCGNDLSLRDAQKASTQWLIGKTMPGFAPCGPCIVTADEFDPFDGKNIKSYVNGILKQDGYTTEMIFNVREIVSYASKYICLEPGDLIFTGTPSGVALEKAEKNWLKPGDKVDVVIEGIGTLSNSMV